MVRDLKIGRFGYRSKLAAILTIYPNLVSLPLEDLVVRSKETRQREG